MMNNKDKISTFSYIRSQTKRERESKGNRSSFPPVTGTLMKDGFSTKDYAGDHHPFKSFGGREQQINGMLFAPGTA